jgi:hypothetical protein
MKISKNLSWLVLCKDGRHYFPSESQVVKFIAKRKGKIGAILHEHKLISGELKIYHKGLKLAGIPN